MIKKHKLSKNNKNRPYNKGSTYKNKERWNKGKNIERILPGQVSTRSIDKVVNVSFPIYEDIITYDSYKDLWVKTVKLFNHLIKHRGPLQGTKRFKQIRTYALKHSLGLAVDPVSCLSLNKKGYPRDIMHLKEHFLSNDEKRLQMALTILNISRLAEYPKKLTKGDLYSITKGNQPTQSFQETVEGFDEAVPKIMKSLGIAINCDPNDVIMTNELIHECTSQGPNSKGRNSDAISTSLYDAKAIIKNKRLSGHLKDVFSITGNDFMMEYINDLSQYIDDKEKVYHSKIINTPNPENKQRIVAMVDYWTQAALKPYERFLTKVEHKIPNSYMFDQDRGRDMAKKFTSNDNSMPISLDGSDFTDRFPMELQRIVLKHLFNEDVANKICKLMVDRSFYVEDIDRYIRYQVGQPMGMHCSFHLANITHAIFAIWCCRRTNRSYADSCVVGDDIIFKHDDTGILYANLMETLNMTFSDFKGFTSTKALPVGEFCKKLFLRGTDIYGYSPRPFLNSAKDYKYIVTLKEHVNVPLDKIGRIIEAVVAKDKYRKDAYDLLGMASIIRSSSIDPIKPIIHLCSENINNLYDDLIELQTSFKQKIAIRKLIFDALLVVRAEENKGSAEIVNAVTKTKNYKVRPPRAFRNPETGDNTRLVDSIRGLMSAVKTRVLFLQPKGEADTSGIVTPLAILNSRIKSADKALETKVRLADIGELPQLLGDDDIWGEVRDTIVDSLITGEFTVFANSVKRFDRNSKNRDKKLFLLSRRMSTIYESKFDIFQFHQLP
jgi:hypothetical protein